MKRIAMLIALASLLSGCATYDHAVIWGYETFIDDTLIERN